MGSPDDYETLYSLLYTLTSVPNVILPFLGGYFVDRLGVRKCLIVFISLLLCGSTVFSVGVTFKSWPAMYVGRVLFGFGLTSTSVSNSKMLADWFGGKELALSFGLNVSIARLGSVVNNLVSPLFAASSVGVEMSAWFGTILLAASFLSVVTMIPIDAKIEQELLNSGTQGRLMSSNNKSLSKVEEERLQSRSSLERKSAGEKGGGGDGVSLWDALKLPAMFRIITISVVLVYGESSVSLIVGTGL